MRSALKFCWLLTLSLSLWSTLSHAQESKSEELEEPAQATVEEPVEEAVKKTAAPTSPSRPWESPKAVRPAAPDVYLLPDASGKLRKVLGFRYEDFFEAWKQEGNATVVAPPRYVLDAWEVTGEASETYARLRIEFEITLQADGWVDMPIQLPKFVVQELTIEEQAEGECLVFDKQRHGHVLWLTGKVGQKRKLVLEGLARLKLNPGSFGLELHLPRATTSQFSLRVSDTSLRFESSPELTVETIADKGGTEVRLLGQANPLRLSWIPAEKQASNRATLVEVEGQTTVRLGRRRAIYEATLLIRNLVETPLEQMPLEKIQVRLPPHATLNLGKTTSGYEIQEEIQEIDAASEKDPRQVVEIRRSVLSSEPWEIRLSAERSFESQGGVAKRELQGFEVLDAIRQSGTVSLEIDDQMQAYFDTGGDIDQMPLSKSTLASEGSSILGQFRYASFPWQLVVYTSPRQKRVSVEPGYDLTISSEEALLEVECNYQFTGAQIFSLHLNLQGWKLTDAPIESGGLIDPYGIVETREGRLVLPLVDSDTKQLRLTLSLRKDIQLGDNTFFLPEPIGAFVVDGELRVGSTEAIQVTPKMEETAGLSEIARGNAALGNLAGQEAAGELETLKLRTFLARPKFVAEVAQRQRQVIATEQTAVEIDQQTVRVRQRIDYQSKYQSVSQLSLSFPELLWLNDSLTITLNGEPLPFGLDTLLDEGPLGGREEGLGGAVETSGLRQILVSLPRPMQNDIPIEIAYELPMPELVTEELSPILLPLALPSDRVRGHKAEVNAALPALVTVDQRSTSDAWQVVSEESVVGSVTEGVAGSIGERVATSAGSRLRLQADEKVSYLPLYAQLDSVDKEQLATLECGWVQSWITKNQRQERAVFRFRTAYATVFAQLPFDLESTEIEVLLDGNPWQHELAAGNRLAIALPAESQRVSHTLELRYQLPATLPFWGKLSSALPRLVCRVASAPIYWQLVLPRGWQVAASPEHLLPDYWLGWKHYRWGRQPTLSQADLEQITGADSLVAPPTLSAQYVYRAFEIPAEIEVVVLRQVGLLLAGVLGAFGLGVLALRTALAQSGLFWLALALTLLVGIFSYPEVTLLAVQVVLAGGLMTFATSVLRRVFAKEILPPISATSNPLQESAVEATETWQPKPLGENPAPSETTATMRTGGPS